VAVSLRAEVELSAKRNEPASGLAIGAAVAREDTPRMAKARADIMAVDISDVIDWEGRQRDEAIDG
jgi:hypothetical protein